MSSTIQASLHRTDVAPSSSRLTLAQVSAERWTELLDQFADANFYQTHAFGSVSWGEHQVRHLAFLRSGHPVAGAQVRVKKLPMLGLGVAYLRWGPCIQKRDQPWPTHLFREVLAALVDEFAFRQRLLLRVIPNIYQDDPSASDALAILAEAGFAKADASPPYRTIRVDISPEPAALRKSLDQKWRNQLNGAERNQLIVQTGDDDALFAEFLRLYDEMMARKQFHSTVDPRAFRRIQAALPTSHRMRISVCYKDQVPQCAIICTGVGSSGIYLLGATSNEGMKSKGSYLLHWNMMLRLRDLGCRWYDLGGINPETNPGVYHFKSGMGGRDSSMLGTFERSDNRTSRLLVSTAEALTRRLARWKARQHVNTAPTTHDRTKS